MIQKSGGTASAATLTWLAKWKRLLRQLTSRSNYRKPTWSVKGINRSIRCFTQILRSLPPSDIKAGTFRVEAIVTRLAALITALSNWCSKNKARATIFWCFTATPKSPLNYRRRLWFWLSPWHPAILAGGHPPTIFAAATFHHQVRDGFRVVPSRQWHQESLSILSFGLPIRKLSIQSKIPNSQNPEDCIATFIN